MIARDIAAIIEELAPLNVQEPWDNAGFTVGDPSAGVKGVLLCVDVTPEIIDEAVDRGANMIISHHPAIFNGLKQLTGLSHTERVVEKAIKNDILLYAAHTNLDNVPQGVNWAIAAQLGLNDVQVLAPGPAGYGTGSGAVGNLPRPVPTEQWVDFLKRTFSIPYVRHSQFFTPDIQRVALCGGSGAFLMDEAIKAGAQCFVSAEFKHHHFFEAQQRLLIVDAGHYESEKYVLSIFFELLTKKMPNFAVRIAENICNPVIYC